MAMSTRWTGRARDTVWSNRLNWTDGVPLAGLDAAFVAPSNLVVRLQEPGSGKHAQVGSLLVHGGQLRLEKGNLDLSPKPSSDGLTYDVVLDQGASLTVTAGATFRGNQTLAIGMDGSAAKLVVRGTVTEEFAVVRGGTLAVQDVGHYVSGLSGLFVGGSGQGTLLVSGGGRVDGGADGLNRGTVRLELGDGFGDGTAIVTGARSSLTLFGVEVGNGYGGTLTIAAGAHVTDMAGGVGRYGDGRAAVSGAGSTWSNLSGLAVGGYLVPVTASLTVSHGGTVTFGSFGLRMFGVLDLDASATLSGPYITAGGEIAAVSGEGSLVPLSQSVFIASNWLFGNRDLVNFGSDAGTTLAVTGAIQGAGLSVVRAGIGHVVLGNAANSFGRTEIYGAVVEAAASGALGAGHVRFVGGATPASLVVDRGVVLGNVVDQFTAADTIDLVGFASDAMTRLMWTPDTSGAGGRLDLLGSTRTSVLFGDSFTAKSFVLADDGRGGTSLTLSQG